MCKSQEPTSEIVSLRRQLVSMWKVIQEQANRITALKRELSGLRDFLQVIEVPEVKSSIKYRNILTQEEIEDMNLGKFAQCLSWYKKCQIDATKHMSTDSLKEVLDYLQKKEVENAGL